MSNTNFQTFHQMGQAINEVVRQATGRDNVQNIDMDHITVAQNHYYQDVDVSGRVVSFHAGAAGLPLEKCVVQIDPVQDLHGYDYPWPAGGGKNLFDISTAIIQKYINEDGNISSSADWSCSDYIAVLPETAYVLSGSGVPGSGATARHAFYDSEKTFISSISTTRTNFTTPSNTAYVRLSLKTESPTTTQLELGSTATAYEPYSNICPITGWTGANVYVSPTTDAADGQTYSITFPSEAGTVYGGTLTVNKDGSGELVVDTKKLFFDGIENKFTAKGSSSRNYYVNILDGTTLGKTSAVWLTQDELDEAGLISNLIETKASGGDTYYHLGCYIGGAIVMQPRFFLPDCETLEDANAWLVEQTNAGYSLEMCYKLKTPNVYNLTAPQITTLLGLNNVWADTGDIEVKFKDLKELY